MNSSALCAAESPPEAPLPGFPTGGFIWRPSANDKHNARFDESLLGLAVTQGPTASLWQAERSLVVPRTYRRFQAFDAACRRFAQQGWPVIVRQTGGGIVPQGPGILNLSLAYTVEGPPLRHSEAGYQLICGVLSRALSRLGIQAFPAAVEGSFCDGRYNLAVEHSGSTVKIAGTAQMWRRLPGTPDRHAGLVHALVLLDTDSAHATRIANAFETALGSDRRYRADRVVSAAELGHAAPDTATRFEQALEDILT